MKEPTLTLMLLASLFSGAALAAAPAAKDAPRTPDPKQSARCNNEVAAKGLKGAERKAFLQECMRGVANTTSSPESLRGVDKPALQTPKP